MSDPNHLTSTVPEFSSTNEIEALKTALENAQQEIQTLYDQLAQTQLSYHLALEMSQFKAGYLARASHELRSPLNSLIGVHQMILSDLCDSQDEEREFITQAHESALRLVVLLDQVIDVSKVESGRAALEIQPFPLFRTLQEVSHLTSLQAKNRNLKLVITLPDKDVYGLADPRCLRQVLMQLVDAAIDASQRHLQISTELDPDHGLIHIDIGDDRPLSLWQEPIDLLQTTNLSQPTLPASHPSKVLRETDTSSSGLSLLIAQTLLNHMQGQLTLLPIATSEPTSNQPVMNILTRLRCSIPLLLPEQE